MILIALLILIVYLTYVFIKIGIPKSISDSFYQLGKTRWLFTATLWSQVFLLLPIWLTLSNPVLQFLVFLSCAGLAFVGAAPFFKQGLDRKVHLSATVVCAICSVLWSCLAGYWLIPLIIIPIAGLVGFINKKPVFWLEIGAFLEIYIVLIIMALI